MSSHSPQRSDGEVPRIESHVAACDAQSKYADIDDGWFLLVLSSVQASNRLHEESEKAGSNILFFFLFLFCGS